MNRYLLSLSGLLILMLNSCGHCYVEDLLKPASDPEIASPRISSCQKVGEIFLDWEEDTSADSYIIERAAASANPVFTTIYEGGALSFSDNPPAENTVYLYRLWKRRGTKLFGPGEVVYGLSTSTERDSWEENNAQLDATLINYDISANLISFCYDSERKSIDVDWYKIVVPPRMIVNLRVDTADAIKMEYAVSGDPPSTFASPLTIEIENTAYKDQVKYFYIRHNSSVFGGSIGGSTVANYTIDVLSYSDD